MLRFDSDRGLALLAALLLSVCATAPAATIDGRFAYLQHRADKASLTIPGSVRFHTPPDPDTLADLAALGLVFADHHSRTVYPARIPLSALEQLSELRAVAVVACGWRPRKQPPLYQAMPWVEGDLAQQVAAPQGGTLTGRGVLVADLDTGVAADHMHLFQLTPERYDWLDNDGSGDLSEGDTVDLDADGLAGPDELLWFDDAMGYWNEGNEFHRYDPGWDVLFHDADGDQVRDLGAADFGELDPCHGERLFLLDDLDRNGRLDPRDQLAALGQSKLRAVRESDGRVFRRGQDLFEAPGDYWGHGTYVNGILAGGWAGRHHMTGVAPGAELLQAVVRYNDEPPLLAVSLEEHVAWAVGEGADVVLIEDGEWVWEFLDGSSNLEIMMNELAHDEGVIFVVPAGNLETGMHCLFDSDQGQGLAIVEGTSQAWPTFLWRGDVELQVTVTTPLGHEVVLPLDGSTVASVGYEVYGLLSTSSRGTRRLDVALETAWEGGELAGQWRFRFAGPAVEMHGFHGDDASGWISMSSWSHGAVASHNVTWPATADSAITVGAAIAHDPAGTAAFFSGRGPRIDGEPVVDLLAPGVGIFCADPDRWNGFMDFAGTSAAAPFVAGAAALLKELDPTLDHGRARAYLRAGAMNGGVDPVGAGAGNLSVMGAVSRLLDDLADEAVAPPHSRVSALPNPFNAATEIRFRQHQRGPAVVRVFDVAGREVRRLDADEAPAGWRTVAWDGRDGRGRAMASGVYLAHVRNSGRASVGKLTLVR